jgi:hypothetical protein
MAFASVSAESNGYQPVKCKDQLQLPVLLIKGNWHWRPIAHKLASCSSVRWQAQPTASVPWSLPTLHTVHDEGGKLVRAHRTAVAFKLTNAPRLVLVQYDKNHYPAGNQKNESSFLSNLPRFPKQHCSLQRSQASPVCPSGESNM